MVLPPQMTTESSLPSAMLCSAPAVMATTLLSEVGTLHCPEVFFPQATTVPSARKARL